MLEEPIELRYNNKQLLGIKHHAKDSGNKPCIIFLHGIPGDRVDAKQVPVKIARKIKDIGFTSIRYDLVSFGVSSGKFWEYTLVDQQRQIENIINQVVTYDDNNGKVVFVVFSEAAKIAVKIASKDKRVIGLCLCNGVITDEIETYRISRFYKEAEYLVYDINCGVWLNKNMIEESKYYVTDVKTLKALNNVVGIYGNGDQLAANSLQLMQSAQKKVKVIDGADHLYTRQDWEVDLINYVFEFIQSFK